MAIKFKVVQKKNPLQQNEAGKFYAQAMVSGTVGIETLSRRIQRASSASRGDIALVLTSLVDEVIESLEEGNSVRLGDLGTMRISVSSTGETDGSKVTANNIRRGRIVFTPSMMLKDRVNRLSFTQFAGKAASETPTPPPGNPGEGGDDEDDEDENYG